MKPSSYRLQEGCETCPHVCAVFDFDSTDEFYCAFGAAPRPKCGSVAMNERVHGDIALHAAWDKWSRGRDVSPRGICEHHPSLKGRK